MSRDSAFERQCVKASEATDVEVHFPRIAGERHQEPFEDDGYLHVMKGKERACFDVGGGQSLCGKQQNERARAVLTALGMARKITPRVLVEEADDEDEDGHCPHCGRG